MIIDKYIRKNIFYYIMVILLVLVSLSSIIKLIEQFRKTGNGAYTIFSAIIYIILNIPKDIEILFPITILLGSLVSLGIFDHSGELQAMQMLGFTEKKVLCSILKVTMPLALFSVLITGYIAPKSAKLSLQYKTKKLFSKHIYPIKKSLWIQHDNEFIYINNINEKNKISGISIYHINKNENKLTNVMHAISGKYDIANKIWILSQVTEIKFDYFSKKTNYSKWKQYEWKTSFTPAVLKIFSINPEFLSLHELYYYIKYSNENKKNTERDTINIWNQILDPISFFVMTVIALKFFFGELKNMLIEIKIILGAILGFLFHIFNKIFYVLTLVYHISPYYCPLFANVLFLTLFLLVTEKKYFYRKILFIQKFILERKKKILKFQR